MKLHRLQGEPAYQVGDFAEKRPASGARLHRADRRPRHPPGLRRRLAALLCLVPAGRPRTAAGQPRAIAAGLAAHAEGYALATLRRRLAATARMHREARRPFDGRDPTFAQARTGQQARGPEAVGMPERQPKGWPSSACATRSTLAQRRPPYRAYGPGDRPGRNSATSFTCHTSSAPAPSPLRARSLPEQRPGDLRPTGLHALCGQSGCPGVR
jgi:hypothetical protein